MEKKGNYHLHINNFNGDTPTVLNNFIWSSNKKLLICHVILKKWDVLQKIWLLLVNSVKIFYTVCTYFFFSLKFDN
jgi:hypothetical protein